MTKKLAIALIERLLAKREYFSADLVRIDYHVSEKVFNNLLVKYGY